MVRLGAPNASMADISRLILESIHTVTALVERDDLQLNRNQCRYLVVCLKQVKNHLFSKPVHIYRQLLDRIRRTVKKVESFVIKCNSKDWLVNALSIGVSEEETKDLVLELKWGLDTHFSHSQGPLATLAGQDQVAPPYMTLPSEEDIRQDKRCLIDKLQVFLLRTSERHKKHYLAVYLQGRLKFLEEASRRRSEAGVNRDSDEGSSVYNPPDLEHILWKPKLPEPSRHQQLGRGSSALVFKTSWLGVPCAKKCLNAAGDKFGTEAGTLATLNHPNIVTLYCCYEDKKSQSLMMELMDGSLFDLLEELRESRNGSPFDLEEAVEILLQIVKGMLYLHRNGFAHRDLKSLNILVSKMKGVQTRSSSGDFVVKVTDFELVKLFDPTYSNLVTLTTRNVGTHVWRAPEVLTKNTDDQKVRVNPRRSDIYSFGMVCFEILSGEIPFKHCGLNNEKLLYGIVHDGLRPTLAEDCPVELRALIERCWDADCARRPAFDEIYDQLLTLRSSLMLGTSVVVTQRLQQVEKFTIRRATMPFIKMCRKFVSFSINAKDLEAYSTLQQATKGQEASMPIDSNRGETSESMKSEGNVQTSELRTGTRLELSTVQFLIPEVEDIPLQSSVEVLEKLDKAINPVLTELNPLNSRSEVKPQKQRSLEDLNLLQVIRPHNAGTLKRRRGKDVLDYSEGALKNSEGDSDRVAANVGSARQSTKTRLARRTTKTSRHMSDRHVHICRKFPCPYCSR